jgi:hypothetical protein
MRQFISTEIRLLNSTMAKTSILGRSELGFQSAPMTFYEVAAQTDTMNSTEKL